eukprot:4305005-Amphidinium_carterae.1
MVHQVGLCMQPLGIRRQPLLGTVLQRAEQTLTRERNPILLQACVLKAELFLNKEKDAVLSDSFAASPIFVTTFNTCHFHDMSMLANAQKCNSECLFLSDELIPWSLLLAAAWQIAALQLVQ